MISPSDLARWAGAGGRLAGFVEALCVYCVVGGGGAPAALRAAAKCAPVLCLAAGVLRHGRGRRARLVAAGLALSAGGDALLVWPRLLAAGMGLFAAAHAAYVAAFGLRPAAPALAAACAAAAAAFVRLLAPPPALARLVPAYALLLAAMAWRGAARPGRQRAGALLFLFSDAVLGYTLFAAPIPYSQVLVMSTYYMAQLLIALSALEPLEPLEPHEPLEPLASREHPAAAAAAH